jgi:hypothetical protein
MIERTYQKTVVNYEKLDAELKSSGFGLQVSHIGSCCPGEVKVYLVSELSAPNATICDNIVNNFIDFTTAESLALYLDGQVFPFINHLINKFASENIALGITQAGKTGAVLGLFEKKYDVHSNGLPISLKGSFDTGSLYESMTILTYLVANSTEFAGLSPFVTIDKLNLMKAEILDFLT